MGEMMQRWVNSGMCLLLGALAGIAPLAAMAQGSPPVASSHPGITYATYFGNSADRINALAIGPDGSVYVAGVTLTQPGPMDVTQWNAGGGRPFVAHVSADGTRLLYFTHLSDGTGDEARAIAVDAAGNAFVTGQSRERTFPVLHALQTECDRDRAGACLGDAFVVKLDPQGNRSFSTYLGGSGEDAGTAIALDRWGKIYVAGSTRSRDFPLVNPAQDVPGGNTDAFVAKIAADGSYVVYSTYLGGSGFDEARGIGVDGAGNAFVTGRTESLDFPTRNPVQPRCVVTNRGRCAGESFVARLSADGSNVLYSTYLGGSGGDSGAAIAVDTAGNAYVAGVTASVDFPLARPIQPALAGKSDAFVAVISPDGSELPFSTYLGGSASDQARTIAIGPAGNLVVSGWTQSEDFPTLEALQDACRSVASRCSMDAFISVVDVDQGRLVFSSYLGGSGADVGQAIAMDARGAAYVTGWTNSKDFPATRSVPATGGRLGNRSGGSFVAKIDGFHAASRTVSCGSGTNNWTGGSGDNKWGSKGNWSLGRVPISSDSVCVASSFSANTITITSLVPNNQVISALSTGAPISFSLGPLTISGASTFAANLAINSGVFVLGGASNMSTLTMGGGALSGAGTLSLSGLLTWSSGSICTVYSTVNQACGPSPTQAIINANGGISFGTGFPALDSRTLNNTLTATMSNSGSYLILLDGATVNNNAGATWNLTADASLNGSSGTFNNSGTFEKTLGSSTSTVQPTFNNLGAVLVNVAALDFTGGGACVVACAGSWTVASAGVLQFDSASFSLGGPVSGSGTVSFNSGSVNLTGKYSVSGTTNVNGGAVGLNQIGSITFAGPVNLANGYVYGSASLTFSGPLTWEYGVMCTSYSTATASCTVPLVQGVTNAIGGITFPFGYATLNARVLNNQQTATMTGAGYFLNLLNNAVVNNKAGATWTLAADSGLSGATGIFNNAGVFQKTGGIASSTIQSVFNNTGTVQANAATLDFAGSGICGVNCSGSWSVAQGGTLQFDSGMSLLGGQISGAGAVVFASGTQTLTGSYNVTGGTTMAGAVVNFSGPITSAGSWTVSHGLASFATTPPVTVVIPTLTLSGGAVIGTNNLTVTGLLNWSGGAMCTLYSVQTQTCATSLPQAITTASGGISLGAGTLQLISRTLNNNQTATMASAGSSLVVADNAVVNNNSGATWNLAADVNLNAAGGTFNNLGTFKKTGGTNASTISPGFVNNGTVQANVATISFSGSFKQAAGNTYLGGGAIAVSSKAAFSGGTLSGQGTLTGAVSNASATVAPGTPTTVGKISLVGSSGNYTQKGSGALNIKIGGTSTGQFDQLVASGTVSLGGSLNVSTINGFSPQPGNTFTIVTGASISGKFSSITSGWEASYKSTSVVLTFQ
jgi:hypothetical protein